MCTQIDTNIKIPLRFSCCFFNKHSLNRTIAFVKRMWKKWSVCAARIVSVWESMIHNMSHFSFQHQLRFFIGASFCITSISSLPYHKCTTTAVPFRMKAHSHAAHRYIEWSSPGSCFAFLYIGCMWEDCTLLFLYWSYKWCQCGVELLSLLWSVMICHTAVRYDWINVLSNM